MSLFFVVAFAAWVAAFAPAPLPLVRHVERTPITELELVDRLEAGHRAALGTAPRRTRLLIAWAVVAYENARGAKVYGHNLGNVGPLRGDARFLLRDGGYYQLFASFDDGAAAFWTRLQAWCPGALQHFDAGDPEGAAAGLRRCGYHRTGAGYERSVRSLYFEAVQRQLGASARP